MRLRGTLPIEHTLARVGAERLWEMLNSEKYVNALGAMSGNQAVQMVAAGLKAIYVSGWQVAADANNAGQMYPDQSLYPADSVPNLCRRLNNALTRADQIHHSEGKNGMNWFAPLIADAEAGFGGTLNAFELMKSMIEAGAACVHFEDQLSSAKKCGHLGGKVLVRPRRPCKSWLQPVWRPTYWVFRPWCLARTDANSAHLLDQRHRSLRSHLPERRAYHRRFLRHSRRYRLGDCARSGLCTVLRPDLVRNFGAEPEGSSQFFADSIHAKYPGKLLAYNCSPSFNWKKKLDDATIARFQPALAEMGYKFQFITLAGFHVLNLAMFELARAYKDTGMTAYSRVQEKEFAREYSHGYSAVKHQRFVGTGYFDEVTQVIASGKSSLSALKHSTEEEQFAEVKVPAQMIEVGQDPSCRPILGECPLTCEHEHEHVRGGNVSAND